MAKKILVLSGSPVPNGNTALLVGWFAGSARQNGAEVEVIETALLKYKTFGCSACRVCQGRPAYECVIDDGAKPVLVKMLTADVIVMATPLYFFSASSQIKVIFDRMFSLYKWDNAAGTMETVLKGKTFAVIASAFEDVGLDSLLAPFALTAKYSSMKFESLLIPNAGLSGDIKNRLDIQQQALEFGKKLA